MKIYFTASLHGRQKYQHNYETIVKILQELGHTVKAEHIITENKKWVEEAFFSEEANKRFYPMMINWLNKSDIVVAEVSYPSVNVGHEITLASSKGKPVIVLYCSENTPHLLEGMDSDRLLVIKYNLDSLKQELKEAIEFLKKKQDERLAIIPPSQVVISI